MFSVRGSMACDSVQCSVYVVQWHVIVFSVRGSMACDSVQCTWFNGM